MYAKLIKLLKNKLIKLLMKTNIGNLKVGKVIETIPDVQDGTGISFELFFNYTKNNHKECKEFIKFLISNNAYFNFVKNFCHSRNKQWLRMHMPVLDPAEYLLDAFHWVLTEEGDEYWSDLQQKYRGEYHPDYDEML